MTPKLKHIFNNSFRDLEGRYLDELKPSDIDLLFEHKLFKCFLPEELQGLGLSLKETFEVFREAAYINGSLGWLVQIGNGGNYFASCFHENVAKELFTSDNAVIAGSGAVSGKIRRCDGGIIASGTWKYCSGSAYASLFTITFMDESSGEKQAAILPRSEVQIIDDWNSIGLRNTSTNSIQLNEVFIPDKHLFDVGIQRSLSSVEAFNFPFVIYAQAFFSQVVLGLLNRLLTEAKSIRNDRFEHWENVFPARLSALDSLLSQGAEIYQEGVGFSEQVVDFWSNHPSKNSPEIEVQQRDHFLRLTEKQRQTAHELFWVLGIDVIDNWHPVSIIYRDLLVCSQHYLLNAQVG